MLSDCTHTLANERRDFVEWHRGRGPYVLWALDVDLPAVRARVAAAARHLEGWLLADYLRQPHITIDLCGFPAQMPQAADEFSLGALAAQVEAADWPAPFEIAIGALDSFASAPFLGVHDPAGGIAALRAAVACDGRNRTQNRYCPHVTVGLYAAAWPGEQVRERLAAFDTGAPLICCIDKLALLAYRPQEIGGELHSLGEFCLREKRMNWSN